MAERIEKIDYVDLAYIAGLTSSIALGAFGLFYVFAAFVQWSILPFDPWFIRFLIVLCFITGIGNAAYVWRKNAEALHLQKEADEIERNRDKAS